MPRVSIITGAYNQDRFIADTVRSVLAQTYTDFEHIVVDDGSKDKTAEVLEPFSSQIRYMRQENQGNVASRNNGLAIAGGEYIAVLDGDDTWSPTKLEKQVRILDEQPRIGLVYTGMVEMDEQSAIVSGIKVDDISGDELRRQLLGNAVPFSSILVRREVLDKGVLVDPRFNQVGDRYLTIQAILQGRGFACVKEPLLQLRTHGASMRYSPAFRETYLSQMLEMLDDINQDHRFPSTHRVFLGKAYAQAYLATAWLMIDRGSREEQRAARRLLVKGLSHDKGALLQAGKQFVKSVIRRNPAERG
jgi:glycosyltransferase involved in cell wall biosynthesis